MSNMFNGATSFNQPLDTWDVSSVEGMTSMFYDATTFNQPLNAWGTNTAAVIYMTAMFSDATNFNQPLDTWDVSSVKGMSSMFNGASAFNRALNAWGTTTASVDTMNAMFFGATSFNQDLDTWDVSSTTDMDSMFEGATNFNGALNGWGTTTASVVDMAGMFLSATNFNQPLDTWDIGALEPTGLNNAFDDTDWSQENYSATLIGWNAQGNTPDDIELETAAKYLSSAEAARASLIADNTWTITDGGLYVAPSSGGSSGTRTGGRSSGGGSSDTVATETLSEREELLARIMELQQLIMQLQSQAGAIVTPGSATASCTFTRDLTTGSNGEDVTCLQTYLMSTGDYTYADGATGYFGSVTKAAVQSWQTKNGVFPAAGYFGPISQRAVKQ
jgi:surface protein